MRALLVGILVLVGSHLASAQTDYAINWFTIDGGGGTSTDGVYAVSGSIGQPDAGTMRGTNGGGLSFTLVGGFWGISAAVPIPSAPALSAKLTGNTVMVYWPSPSTGYIPQLNTNLATTNWVTPAETVQDNGAIKYMLVSPPVGNRFYRLTKP